MQFSVLINSNPVLKSLLIFFDFLIIGWVVHTIFTHGLRKIVGKTKTKIDDALVEILAGPIYFTVILSGFYFAFLSLVFSVSIIVLFKNIIYTLLIAVWGVALLRISRDIYTEIRERKATRIGGEVLHEMIPFLDNITKIIIAIIAFLITLSIWGINITPALASAGVIGVAVAFASRDVVANVFGGVSVFFDRPYKTGDYVIINDQYRGEVIQIGTRSTKIRTRDNILLTVPNSVMVTNTVINETGFDPKLRVRIPFSVSYGTDLEKAESVIVDVAKNHPEVLHDPESRIRYRKFGDYGIELELLSMIETPSERGRIIHELIKAIDKRLKKEKITIPFPQQDIYIYKMGRK